MRKETRALYRRAYSLWSGSQLIMVIEEASELIKAVCKYWRKPSLESGGKIIEEIADLRIMLEQLEVIFDCEEKVRKAKFKKLKRLRKRIEEHERTSSSNL